MNMKKSTDSRTTTLKNSQKKPYVSPEIIMVEQLEAIAFDCSSTGKEAPGAPAPGGGACATASS